MDAIQLSFDFDALVDIINVVVKNNNRHKYNVINRKREEEPWTGIFDNLELTEKWYAKYGQWHEERGHKLILVEIKSDIESDAEQLDIEYDEL